MVELETYDPIKSWNKCHRFNQITFSLYYYWNYFQPTEYYDIINEFCVQKSTTYDPHKTKMH